MQTAAVAYPTIDFHTINRSRLSSAVLMDLLGPSTNHMPSSAERPQDIVAGRFSQFYLSLLFKTPKRKYSKHRIDFVQNTENVLFKTPKRKYSKHRKWLAVVLFADKI